jgi:hypothetical protein
MFPAAEYMGKCHLLVEKKKKKKCCGVIITTIKPLPRRKGPKSVSVSVYVVFYLYNNNKNATIHIHLYNIVIYSDHVGGKEPVPEE